MQMSARAEAFDRWIRGSFVALNTELEELYFRQEDRARVEGVGDALKATLRDEGHVHVVALLKEGNTGDGFESGFNVLGNVGLYLGALRRHELTNPAREERSPFPKLRRWHCTWAPRSGWRRASRPAISPLTTGRSMVCARAYLVARRIPVHRREHARHSRVADRRRCTHAHRAHRRDQPGCRVLFAPRSVRSRDVLRFNERLFAELDIERFFFCVRPYYKPYRVGRLEYRGANAGDFSGINELDLLLACAGPTIRITPTCWSTRCLHVAGGPGTPARMHDIHQPAGRIARVCGRARGSGVVSAKCHGISSKCAISSGSTPRSITTVS